MAESTFVSETQIDVTDVLAASFNVAKAGMIYYPSCVEVWKLC